MTNFAFAIPIAPYVDPEQWRHLETMLSETLHSVLNQSDPRFRVFIAGHERPSVLDKFTDERIEFLPVQFDKPASVEDRRKDKRRKRWAVAARFRQIGAGYFMYLDADDYVHRDIVSYVFNDNNKSGYYIPDGYALDYRNRILAPVPGAFRKPFNHVCGSSGIVFFEENDLPAKAYPAQRLQTSNYFKIRNHLSFDEIFLRGRPTAPIPFPAGIYNLNNELNLSNVLVRTAERQVQLVDGIRKRRITDTKDIARDFGITNV